VAPLNHDVTEEK